MTTTPTSRPTSRTPARPIRPDRVRTSVGSTPPPTSREPAAAPRRRGRAPIPALTGVRVVLASWIIAHHLIRWLCKGNGLEAADFWILRQGQAATSGFFVLGGIGLFWAYGERLTTNPTLESWGTYMRRRWASIWPVGVLGATLAIPYEIHANIMNGAELVGAYVLNVLLLQAWLPVGGGEHGASLRFDGPTWTLSALLFWYAMFPIVALFVQRFVRGKRGLVALGTVPWLVVVLVSLSFADQPLGQWLLHVHPFVRGADILAGVAIGAWIERYGRPSARGGWMVNPRSVVACFAAAISAHWLEHHGGLAVGWLFGAWFIPPMALLAIGLTAEGGPLVRLFAWRRLERPGRVAFAMLMLHVPFISLGWQLGIVRPDRPIAVALLLIGCLAVSYVVHLRVERPLVRRLAGGATGVMTAPVAAAPIRAER
jgi:peptidoglycan/LPS O-acetylase OafA/YrhL